MTELLWIIMVTLTPKQQMNNHDVMVGVKTKWLLWSYVSMVVSTNKLIILL